MGDATHAPVEAHRAALGDLDGPRPILPVGDRNRVGYRGRTPLADPLLRQGGHANKDFPQGSTVAAAAACGAYRNSFGSLEALREGGGQLAAVLLTVGLAVSLLPILLRVLRPVRRDATIQPRDPQPWVTLLGLILFAAVVVLLILIG